MGCGANSGGDAMNGWTGSILRIILFMAILLLIIGTIVSLAD
jgi:hypothetical protein